MVLTLLEVEAASSIPHVTVAATVPLVVDEAGDLMITQMKIIQALDALLG